MGGKMCCKWILFTLLSTLLIHNINGQRPSVPANVNMDLEFVDDSPIITGKWNALVFTPSVEQYMLQLTINGSSPVNTTVPASTTMVDIFNIFPSVIKKRHTLYSLRVAAINSVGIGAFSDSASVVTSYLQLVSVTAGVRTITVSCSVANSMTRTYCSAHFSPGTPDASVYTFQQDTEDVTVNYAPGQHNISVKVSAIINGILVIVEESDFVVIVPAVSSSFILATPSITASTSTSLLVSTTTSSLSPSDKISSSTSMSLAVTSSTSTHLPTSLSSFLSTSSVLQATPIAGSGGSEGSAVVGAVLATVVVTTIMMIITVVFTVFVLLWWRHYKNGRDISDTSAPAPVPEKQPCKSPSINIETTSCPLYQYEDMDTIRDARYSMVNTPNNKSRVNSAIASNHSSYVEMSSVTIMSARNVVMQPNPSYTAINVTNS